MENYKTYKELTVWIAARKLVKTIYQVSSKFPKEEEYGLKNQMRRASISIPSNIAEGCGRNHAKDSTQFLFIARGSLYELETQLYLAQDLDYLQTEHTKPLFVALENCRKLLNGFIRYYQNRQP